MPMIDFPRLRSQLDIQDILALYAWWEPTARDRNGLRGPCLWREHTRQGANRLLSINLERGIWQCFGCNKSGNALELYAEAEKLNIYLAALKLADELALELPIVGSKRSTMWK